jgi:hypothetical protein
MPIDRLTTLKARELNDHHVFKLRERNMDMFKMNLQLFAEEGEEVKTFTQEDVDRIVQERIARVKKEVPEDYEDLKAIDEELKAFGYEGTAKERREAIKAQREAVAEQTRKQQELEELQRLEEEDELTPAQARKMKSLEDSVKQLSETIKEITSEKQKVTEEQKAKAKADAEWQEQVSEMNETHPDVDLEELGKNAKFLKFIKGKGMPLKELYEDFVEFVGETEAEAIIKVKSKDIRSTSSGKGNNSEGNSYGLSTEEKALVDDHNRKYPKSKMSYKEYSENKRN